jgi:hypothetical protein
MRFARWFQAKQNGPIHTVGLGDEHGNVKSGTSSHDQYYSRRKELEQNRQHINAYHASSIAQGHLANHPNNRSLPSTRPSIDIVKRPGAIQRQSVPQRPTQSGYHFKEPPSRQRPGY